MKKTFVFLFAFFVVSLFLIRPTNTHANHSWDGYHWARTANPFTLKLGDNLSSVWDPYLSTAATDWSQSSVLDLTVVPGLTTARRCKPTSGRIEVCNSTYGNNGWLGIAQIWISGSHITQGITKMNDTYFNSATYNTPAWKRLVVCQEVAHAFGLDHQDEVFNNPNLGSCMDYTNNPVGPLSNEHPNTHDYEQLEAIYTHLDGFSTLQSGAQKLPYGQLVSAAVKENLENRSDWGQEVRNNGHVALYERDFGGGNKVFTHVIWAQE